MPEQPLRLLATADVHLGRRSTHLGDHVSPEDAATRSVWADIIELAIRRKVDALLLAGDIVDENNRYFEAWGPLESGLKRLSEHGIRTFAVAGNHDHDVFPRLMDDLGAGTFTLLGRDGKWESQVHNLADRPACQLIGWSFPKQHWPSNPLMNFDLTVDRNIPSIALLHTQLDDSQRRYAPVHLAELGATDVNLWVLGHIHLPAVYDVNGRNLLYCGSPQALDPGETGVHGVRLISVQHGGRIEIETVPTSRVRYESLDVNLAEVATDEEAGAVISREVTALADGIATEDEDVLRGVSVRVTLTGRTPAHRQLEEIKDRISGELEIQRNHFMAFIDEIVVATRPALDIDTLATSPGIAGELARLILSLETGEDNEEVKAVLKLARPKVSDLHRPLPSQIKEPDSDALHVELLAEARRLLDVLMASREGE